MRQSQKNNRARSKNGRKSNGPSINRVYESTGPEGKVRGTPQQIIEKYQSLARDKATAGDRILAESFLQHAEHYLRILGAAQAAQSQPRREEREEDESEAHEAEQPSVREQPSAEGGGRSRAVSDGLAVMDADGASEMVATPESFTPPARRGVRRKDEADGELEGEETPRRPRRRPARRTKDDAVRTETEEQPSASVEPVSVVEPSEPAAEARSDGGDNEQDGGEWQQTSAIGHA